MSHEFQRHTAQFRHVLVQNLKQKGSQLEFGQLVAETGVDPMIARHAADSLFTRIATQAFRDGVITDAEKRRLRRLARVLQISEQRRETLQQQPAIETYQQALQSAESDGFVTVAEQEVLDQLRVSLGLNPAAVTPREPPPAERLSILAEIEASSQFASRDSAERIHRARAEGQKSTRMLFMLAILATGLTATAAVGLLVLFITQPDGGADARIAVQVLLLIMASGGAMLTFVVWFYWAMRRVPKRAVVTSMSGVLALKRHSQTKVIRDGSLTTTLSADFYYATFNLRNGEPREFELRNPKLAERLSVGDAGVLYVQAGTLVDFDCVLTAEAIRERHIRGAIECDACATVYKLAQVPTNCINCGALIQDGVANDPEPVEREDVYFVMPWLERWSEQFWSRRGLIHEVGAPSLKEQVDSHVTCGWCHKEYERRPDHPNCRQCGGTLTMPPGNDPGPRPLDPPRELPRGFAADLYLWRNDHLKYSAIMLAIAVAFCPALPFLLPAGLLGLIYSQIVARRKHVAFARGKITPGSIERVQRIGNSPQPDNSRNEVYRVFFRFSADDRPMRGMFYAYDASIANHYVGEPLWVVHLPSKPHICATWPPFA